MSIQHLKPIRSGDWDHRKARHLLNRAGFGVPSDRVEYLAGLPLTAAVDYLVQYETVPDASDEPSFLIPASRYAGLRGLDRETRRKENNTIRKEERFAVGLLQQWWLKRMYTTSRPLEEKMTLFWHGHFATSAQKVNSSTLNYMLNDIFRDNATGNLKALTVQVAKSPAMLRYLDNTQNVKAHPNENWARELMELFTLGIGNYTEDDIKESARSFTGWAANLAEFVYRKGQHDTGMKTFLGRRGNFDGYDIIDIIFEQPAAAEFICTKLFTYFAYPDPEPEVVQALAQQLRASNYDLKPVLTDLFLSKAFYSKKSMGSQIKSPVQFMIQLAHDMDMDQPPYHTMAQGCAQLGQDLFFPPNVKGWDGGRMWINANTLLTRYNMPVEMANANGPRETMMMAKGMEEGMMVPGMMKQNMREEFKQYMQTLPQAERQVVQRDLRKMKGEERRGFVEAQLNEYLGLTPWNAKTLFNEIKFDTAGECVDALVRHFLATSLSGSQERVLLEALGVFEGRDTRLAVKDLDEDHMNATLHLLLSMAEYQLC